jgi:hypothetical protein
MSSRRACLATLASASLVGCFGTPPSTSSRPALNIEAAAVQYSYRYIEDVDWNAIQPADGQFVFVTVDASEIAPIPSQSAFTLVADDEIHDPVEIDDYYPGKLDVSGEAYAPDQEDSEPRGWLVFDVPAQLDTTPSLRLERETDSWEWELDTEKATTPPPAWEWTASAPETVAPDETFDITVTAENVGDGPGTFRGAVNFSGAVYRAYGFDIVLEPGVSDEATVSASSNSGQFYEVRTPAGRSEVTVAVEESSTT